MAKAKKLPSGAWRTQVYSHTVKMDGKDKRIYESFTAETKSESEYLAAEFLLNKSKKAKRKTDNNITVGEAVDRYIELNELLSPTTIQSYKKIRRTSFEDLMNVKLKDLAKNVMQLAINKEAKKVTRRKTQIAPKTVANSYGLISTAIYDLTDIHFNVSLPKIPPKNIDLPSPKDIIAIIKGTSIELPCMLAMWLSFSMSEIRGIKCSSIRNNVIYIDQVVVDVNGKAVEKSLAKAENRIRKHQLPEYLIALIKQQESYIHYMKTGEDCFLIPMTASQIANRYRRMLKKTNFYVSFHKLRHLNASVMLQLNIPDKYAMERGGWKTPHTMKSVYQHTFSDERRIIDKKIDDYFKDLL